MNNAVNILQQSITLPVAHIVSSLAQENWERMFAYNPIKQERYYPKNCQNASTTILSVEKVKNEYPDIWAAFANNVQSHIDAMGEANLFTADEVYFMCYNEGDYVPMHDDTGDIIENGRTKEVAYTSLLYLSEIEGGELVLPERDITVSCKAGELITFPAETKHGVNKIVSGRRYVAMYRHYRYKEAA